MAQNLVLISFKCGISSYFDFQFPLRYFCNHYFLLLNVFLMQNMKKTYSLFFHNIGPNLCQILPLRLCQLFCLLISNILGDSTDIDNLRHNPVVLKKKW